MVSKSTAKSQYNFCHVSTIKTFEGVFRNPSFLAIDFSNRVRATVHFRQKSAVYISGETRSLSECSQKEHEISKGERLQLIFLLFILH